MLFVFALFMTGCNKSEPAPAPSNNVEQSIDTNTSSVIPPEETYHIVRPEYTPDYDNYEATFKPFAFNMTYYSDIYSRGFAWFTNAVNENGEADESAKATELYLVKSDKGEQADFSKAQLIEGTSLAIEYNKDGNISSADNVIPKTKGSSNDVTLNLYSHKVHVENLEKGKAYSYKAGSEAGYTYGAFIVEKEQAQSITAVHMSDAQTKDLSQTNVWRNTFTKAVTKAGEGLDLALYNGDQFDQNNSTGNNKTPSRVLRYAKAIDVIGDYKFDIPYMASSGNHEPSIPYINYLTSDIDYPTYEMNEVEYHGYIDSGCYYSFDYQYAHFVVLNTNSVNDAQIQWLKDDLYDARNAKWKVVMMHISPYSTGDHTNKSDNQKMVEKLTPVFSENHVDLVLQAHDHTYNKTLPYKWNAAGYTTTYNNADVVNFEPQTEKVGDVEYDKNPEGTYYVTTGAAGHRCGAPEATDGIWAEVVQDGDEWKALDSDFTYLNNKYKIEMGKIKYSSTLEAYDGKDDNKNSFHSDQIYEVGHLATGCVNAQMFGVLNMTETTLSYNVYTVSLTREATIFDSVDILKA